MACSGVLVPDPVREMELAAEVLDARGEAAVKSVLRSVAADFATSPEVIGDVVEHLLPLWLRLLGSETTAGPGLARRAGAFLGLELEGLSGEDRALEVARRLIRMVPAELARQAQPVTTVEGRSSGSWQRRGDLLVLFDI